MNPHGIPALIGEQKRILEPALDETILVKGGAGCGKTTVAVARARQYVHDYADFFNGSPRVLFVSYTNALVDGVRKMLGGAPEGRLMTIKTLHSVAGSLMGQGDSRTCCSDRDRKNLIDRLPGRPANYDAEFLGDEFSWIKGMLLADEAAYLAKERRGRGNTPRVTQADRPSIWRAFEAYQREMAARNFKDWDDILIAARSIASKDGFVPPYTHIVIDEAQDLTPLGLTLIGKLVQGRSVTLVADSAQQIYQSGFSWRETGFQVKSHCSIGLTQNYRNTCEISAAARPLRSKILSCDKETEACAELARTHGEKPSFTTSARLEDLLRAIETAQADPANQTFCVAEPHRRLRDQTATWLQQRGFQVQSLSTKKDRFPAPASIVRSASPAVSAPAPTASTSTPAATVYVDTYHAMKGLEFDAVFLNNISEREFPGDPETQDEEAVNRRRKLLYVAMTRARRTLHLFAPETPSRLLGELEPETLSQTPAPPAP